jgi:hypothetical protein
MCEADRAGSEHGDRRRNEPASQAWTPAGPANAVRLALRSPSHGKPEGNLHIVRTTRKCALPLIMRA